MMQEDYTLIIPTYNRSHDLKRLLSYLDRQKASFQILILDSSNTTIRADNQQIVKACSSSLQIIYREYAEEMKPFDKFYEGIKEVRTPFCQFCADDDLVIVESIAKCIDCLKLNAEVSLVHGYYFGFSGSTPDTGMDISQVLYYTPSNDADQPLVRLKNLFKHYQALTYGVYRTPILERILGALKSVDRILARELLGSALAVVYGKAIRLPFFTQGRSMEASQSYQFWHPLEWLARSPADLFAEYKAYKKILVDAIANPLSLSSQNEIERQVDLIHMDYLLHHTPLDAYEFLMDNIMCGKTVDEIWPSHEIQIPLIKAAHATCLDKEQNSLQKRIKNKLKRIFFKRKMTEKNGATEQFPVEIKTTTRTYRLHKDFLYPSFADDFYLSQDNLKKLTMTLDGYY